MLNRADPKSEHAVPKRVTFNPRKLLGWRVEMDENVAPEVAHDFSLGENIAGALENDGRGLMATHVRTWFKALEEIADTFEIDWHEAQSIAREALGRES